jgi:hypothetical protein
LAQDYATHGTFTEPNTGISFYTSIEANGAISGDGDMSTVSVGGFTFGIALPGNAATVDSYEYIGLIVCFDWAVKRRLSAECILGWLFDQWGRMVRYYSR